MNPRAGIGRADLLLLLREKGNGGTGAECLGFRFSPPAPGPAAADAGDAKAKSPNPGAPSGGVPAPVGRPRARFLIPAVAEFHDPDPVPVPVAKVPSITDDELKMPRDIPNPPRPPLAPWPRLAHFVRDSLGARREGSALDVNGLVRLTARGRPLTEIPRRVHTGWAAGAVLLLDGDGETMPFWQDLADLRGNVWRERGRCGLTVEWLKGPPGRARIARWPAGVPVLLAGAMGQLTADAVAGEQWRGLGLRLRRRGHALSALIPAPRRRWRWGLDQIWRSAVWDRRERPPRGLGLRALRDAGHATGVEPLLQWLSPATIVELGLVRAVRLLLGSAVDVGAEFDAWTHADCRRNPGGFAFRIGMALGRLESLRARADAQAVALKPIVAGLIARYHLTCSRPIAAEAWQRLEYAGMAPEIDCPAAESFLASVVGRLREIARHPGCPAGRRTGLPRWVLEAAASLPRSLRGDHDLGAALALAFHWCDRANIRWPDGVDRRVIEEELRRLVEDPGELSRWQLGWRAGELRLGRDAAGIGLGTVWSRRVQFNLRSGGADAARDETRRCEDDGQARVDSSLSEALTVGTDLQMLHLASIPRPEWAERMGYDRYGLYADLEVRKVRFRMRWIPPGRFEMGDEVEGPIHEVTISEGFWLAETQTTQALWKAVMSERASFLGKLFKQRDPADPSHFKGEERPVDSVSWDDCRAFCAALGELVPDLQFSLPTEAQWEYACRAGTTSRFNNGSDNDEAMKELGWFDESIEKGETHPVRQKIPNAWGLYDLHGNVWEWCLDWFRAYAGEAEPDPIGAKEGQLRVLRGGAYWHNAGYCRSAFRLRDAPANRLDDFGFRLAAGRELKSKPGSGALGLWAKGAVAPAFAELRRGEPGLRDEAFTHSPRRGAEQPAWASDIQEDRYGVLVTAEIGGVAFEFRRIRKGNFQMGSPKNEAGRYDDEGPEHEVELTRDFWLAATPVTQEQWRAIMTDNPNPSRFKGDRRPVEQVSWEDCREYVQRLNERLPGLNAGLPTEAQWEYACRAGTTSRFNNGSDVDEALKELGWYGENSGMETHEAKQKQPNQWGLYDMHGNVLEWCRDWYGEYDGAKQVDPTGPKQGQNRVLRGGAYWDRARGCRSAYRYGSGPAYRNDSFGFRLAAGLEPFEEKTGAERASLRGATAGQAGQARAGRGTRP